MTAARADTGVLYPLSARAVKAQHSRIPFPDTRYAGRDSLHVSQTIFRPPGTVAFKPGCKLLVTCAETILERFRSRFAGNPAARVPELSKGRATSRLPGWAPGVGDVGYTSYPHRTLS
jgi:hypothetical protein